MKKIIYENKNIEYDGVLNFKDRILFDQTDHFCFACNNCNQHLDVYKVSLFHRTLFFFTKCPDCELQNQRKIYLDSDVNKKIFGNLLKVKNFESKSQKMGYFLSLMPKGIHISFIELIQKTKHLNLTIKEFDDIMNHLIKEGEVIQPKQNFYLRLS